MTDTPRLTQHARERCQQMNVSTKRVKRILQNPDLVYPGPLEHGDNYLAGAEFDREILVAFVVEDGVTTVKTVLFRTNEYYVRP